MYRLVCYLVLSLLVSGGSASPLIAECCWYDQASSEGGFDRAELHAERQLSETWQPTGQPFEAAVRTGDASWLRGKLLLNHWWDVQQDRLRYAPAGSLDLAMLQADQVLLFAATRADGSVMPYAQLPAASAPAAPGTVGIFPGGFNSKSALRFGEAANPVSYSFNLEADSHGPPLDLAAYDQRRLLTYASMARELLRSYVRLTGTFPESYPDLLQAHEVAHDLDPAWEGATRVLTVAINDELPAVRFSYNGALPDQQHVYEVYTIHHATGTVESEVLFPPDALFHPASQATYRHLYTAHFPLLAPQ